mmetsp:Transcript_23923/g.66400  ORF Transcript_23923/g.66400 Transcript_23923/m.66400 type:complete len:626 (-) Transcript_23923:206-2083(-)
MFHLGSVVEDNGPYSGWCGYCSGSDTNACHGMWAHGLTVEDYNSLLDRGWRRSGCWLYQPDMRKTCCPQYTIRLHAADFRPNKQQSKAIRKVRGWLASQKSAGNADGGAEATGVAGVASGVASTTSGSSLSAQISSPSLRGTAGGDGGAGELQAACQEVLPATARELLHGAVLCVRQVSKKQRKGLPAAVRFSSAVSFAAAAAARKAGDLHAAADRIAASLASALSQGQGQDRLACLGVVRVEADRGHLNFHMAEGGAEGKTAAGEGKGEEAVKRPRVAGKPPEAKGAEAAATAPRPQGEGAGKEVVPLPMRFLGWKPGDGGTQLQVEIVAAMFDEEEFLLYKKYQTTQHRDKPEDITRSVYTRFLVDTPLQSVAHSESPGAPPCGYGSFHIRYKVEGRLLAVSVVDILPRCVSSKYFFWDTDLRSLSLGKFSTLFEVYWIQQILPQAPQLRYYYLGYYIHNCPKMRYKAEYQPSDLLCPVRYVWLPYESVKELLEQRGGRLCVLSDVLLGPGDERRLTAEDGSVGENDGRAAEIVAMAPVPVEVSKNACSGFSKRDVLSVPVLKQGQLMQLRQELGTGDEDSGCDEGTNLVDRVLQWANAAGLPSRRMVYVLPALWASSLTSPE